MHTITQIDIYTGELEKAALAQLVSKGLTAGGKFLARNGAAASQAGRTNALNAIRQGGGISTIGRDAASKMLNAGRAEGSWRTGVGNAMRRGSIGISKSPGMQKAVNYGGGTLLAGAGLYGANRIGHASGHEAGREAGIGEGMDAGMEAGVAAAAENQQQNQPGYLGGLWNAVKGQSGGGGVNVGNTYSALSASRQGLIDRLMGGPPQ